MCILVTLHADKVNIIAVRCNSRQIPYLLPQIFYMQFVAAIAAVCPLRSEASHRSEMVSQLLFGEGAEVLEAGKDFTKIRCLYDRYEAWVQTSQLTEVDE